LQLVGFLLILNYDAQNHELKISSAFFLYVQWMVAFYKNSHVPSLEVIQKVSKQILCLYEEIKMQTVKSYMTFKLVWNKFWNKKLHIQANLGKRNMLHVCHPCSNGV